MANNKNITYDQLEASLNRVKTELDKKAASSHGTHLTLGTGSSNAYRGDYGNIAYTHSQAAHAPSNAQKNQNAFSNITVGSTTIAADTTTDTLTIVAGSNITLTPDATNDKLTIAATNTTYNAASQSAAGLMSAADKKKLDGIAEGANNYTYTLPAATSSVLGGVKIGSNITVSSGTISLSKTNVTNALGYTPPTSDTNTTYTFATGDNNGTFKVTPSGGTASNISIKGLGSAAYLAASETDSASTVVKRNADGRIKISDMPTGQKEADYIAVGSTRTGGALGMITASEFKSYLSLNNIFYNTGGTISGDVTMQKNLTVTGNITGAKVYGAVYNDYAEWFEREDVNEVIEAGDIVSWGENGVTKSTESEDSLVIGVYSDSYGHILGGEELADMEENIKKYVPIGLCGRVYVKVTGEVKRGDLITTSDIPGVGAKSVNKIPGTIIGKALESYDGKDGIKKIKIMVFNN